MLAPDTGRKRRRRRNGRRSRRWRRRSSKRRKRRRRSRRSRRGMMIKVREWHRWEGRRVGKKKISIEERKASGAESLSIPSYNIKVSNSLSTSAI
jgi:hypothetical protein